MKAKFVNEALTDVLKPKSEEEIENIVLSAIQKGDISILKNLYKYPISTISKVVELVKEQGVEIPRDYFEIILQNMKHTNPEKREELRQALQMERVPIMDRDPEELSIDRDQARKMLIDYGFNENTTPRQEKNGSLSFQYSGDMKLEQELYKKQKWNEAGDLKYFQPELHVVTYIIYPNGAIRKSKSKPYGGSAIGKMRVEDPFLTYEENAEFLINYMNKKIRNSKKKRR